MSNISGAFDWSNSGKLAKLASSWHMLTTNTSNGYTWARSFFVNQILAPLPIGFVVFLVHLATIPITGTGINPARSLGAAIIYNKSHAWDDHWIFWVGPFIGAALTAVYHTIDIRAIPFKSRA